MGYSRFLYNYTGVKLVVTNIETLWQLPRLNNSSCLVETVGVLSSLMFSFMKRKYWLKQLCKLYKFITYTLWFGTIVHATHGSSIIWWDVDIERTYFKQICHSMFWLVDLTRRIIYFSQSFSLNSLATCTLYVDATLMRNSNSIIERFIAKILSSYFPQILEVSALDQFNKDPFVLFSNKSFYHIWKFTIV